MNGAVLLNTFMLWKIQVTQHGEKQENFESKPKYLYVYPQRCAPVIFGYIGK